MYQSCKGKHLKSFINLKTRHLLAISLSFVSFASYIQPSIGRDSAAVDKSCQVHDGGICIGMEGPRHVSQSSLQISLFDSPNHNPLSMIPSMLTGHAFIDHTGSLGLTSSVRQRSVCLINAKLTVSPLALDHIDNCPRCS